MWRVIDWVWRGVGGEGWRRKKVFGGISGEWVIEGGDCGGGGVREWERFRRFGARGGVVWIWGWSCEFGGEWDRSVCFGVWKWVLSVDRGGKLVEGVVWNWESG